MPRLHLQCREAKWPEEVASAVSLHFLAEGAANVVFRVRPFTQDVKTTPVVMLDMSTFPRDTAADEGSPPTVPRLHPIEDLLGQVLRVSKGHDKTPHGSQVKFDFEERIVPLFQEKDESGDFEEFLLGITTVELEQGILPGLNEQIWSHSKREKKDLPAGSVGLLMHDMSSEPGRSLTIEIKPKWLAQSANAPEDAYRCRTCALHAQRQAKSKAKDESQQNKNSYICPFELRDGNIQVVERYISRKVIDTAAHYAGPLDSALHLRIVKAITEYLCKGKGNRLLHHLAALQVRHDQSGVLGRRIGGDNSDLQIAMTLRDTSFFIRARFDKTAETLTPEGKSSEGIGIEAKLADLDFKDEAKFSDWREKEEQLLNGGWYIYQQGNDSESKEQCKLAKEFRKTVPYMW